jgi:hypothetical protein
VRSVCLLGFVQVAFPAGITGVIIMSQVEPSGKQNRATMSGINGKPFRLVPLATGLDPVAQALRYWRATAGPSAGMQPRRKPMSAT